MQSFDDVEQGKINEIRLFTFFQNTLVKVDKTVSIVSHFGLPLQYRGGFAEKLVDQSSEYNNILVPLHAFIRIVS